MIPKPQWENKERLTARKDMTIAGGVICSDGIVLCADTEHTKGDSKYQKQKIFSSTENRLMVTGAGTSDYIKVAFDKLNDEMKSVPSDRSAARNKVEEIISKMYDEHLRPYQTIDPDLDVSLIVAIRCANNKLALIKTVKSTADLEDHYAVVGSGWHLFEYWATYFLYRMSLSMEVTSHFLIFILQEIKMAGYACGGATTLEKMPMDSRMIILEPRHTIYPEMGILAGFPQSAIDVLFSVIQSTPMELDKKLAEFKDLVVRFQKELEPKPIMLGTATDRNVILPKTI